MITFESLTKVYGDRRAVDDISLQIAPGMVTGYLGPNGAGKSTTMRMLLGLDRPTSGRALIDGRTYTQLRHPLHTVGALLEPRTGHPGQSARSHLLGMARSNGIASRRVDEALGTKLISIRSTWWIIASALAAALLGSWLFGASALASGRNGLDSAMLAPYIVVQTMLVVEMVIVLLATFSITGEYSTGSIMTTLQSVPRRGRVLLSKTAVVFASGLALGAALILVGTPVAAISAAEFGAFEFSDLLRAMVGTGVGLGLLGVFVLGLGTALRSASLTIITTLGLLHLIPNLLPLFGNDAVSEFVRYLPNQAITVLVNRSGDNRGREIGRRRFSRASEIHRRTQGSRRRTRHPCSS